MLIRNHLIMHLGLSFFCVSPNLAQSLKMYDSIELLPPLTYPDLARIAKVQGYSQLVISIKDGVITDIHPQSDGHSPFKQEPLLINESTKLVKKIKFKTDASGYMIIHFFFRLDIPLPSGSTPPYETYIDWQNNKISFTSAGVKLDLVPLHGAKN